jgi:hypothetical protein
MDYRLNMTYIDRNCIYIYNHDISSEGYGPRYLSIVDGSNYLNETPVLGIGEMPNNQQISVRVCVKIAALYNSLDKFKEMYYLDKATKQ